uniref:Reverse transcriptase domain-containing protein n=1 Tax=Tanacetum cinerariifolium TaxID=118510 RepID=A0A699K6D7_TANCI|nr:hypothetical protein [Tanacetum cinerariifolium]
MNSNNIQGTPPAGPPPQNHNGPPRPNLHMPAPDLRTIEELCQPTMNGRGGPIALVNIQATDFGLKNHIIQQVQNRDGLLISFEIFPPSMVTKLRNDITNFRQLLDESLFEAWERYKLSIDRCPNPNMFPITQIDTFYNELTSRHRDTINVAVGGTFMKRRPKECYDLIKNMTTYHNDWDTSAHMGESSSSTTSSFEIATLAQGESSSSTTSSSFEIAALTQQMTEMRKDILQMYRSNQQVNYVTPSCETYGGPHSYYECQAAGGYT